MAFRAWQWRRPDGVLIIALAAWAGLAVMLTASTGNGSRNQPSAWWCMPGMSRTSGSSLAPPWTSAVTGLPMWAVMALAMMLPAALPAARHVALNSLSWRRGRAVSMFVAVYAAVWIAFGFVAMAAVAALTLPSGGMLLVAALAVAGAWELTPLKRRALNRCHSTSPLPPTGWRAHLGVTRFALRHGGACVASCWATMLVMFTAQSGRLFWCMGFTATTAIDKLTLKPRRYTRLCAALLGGAAVTTAMLLLAG
jgi:predicted metal-binding membrane protein